MDQQTTEQVELMKPRRGALILLVPVAAVFLVFALYIVAFSVGIYGRAADGERADMTWRACPEAQAIIAHRVEGMGLGEPVFAPSPGGFTLTATLPADPEVAAEIPHTLIAPGVLEAHPESEPGRMLLSNAHVTGAAIRQDITLSPWTVLTLTPEGLERLLAYVREKRDGRVVYTLDGTTIGRVSNLNGAGLEVELSPEGTTEVELIRKAAARAIVLDSGPLPCTVTP